MQVCHTHSTTRTAYGPSSRTVGDRITLPSAELHPPDVPLSAHNARTPCTCTPLPHGAGSRDHLPSGGCISPSPCLSHRVPGDGYTFPSEGPHPPGTCINLVDITVEDSTLTSTVLAEDTDRHRGETTDWDELDRRMQSLLRSSSAPAPPRTRTPDDLCRPVSSP